MPCSTRRPSGSRSPGRTSDGWRPTTRCARCSGTPGASWWRMTWEELTHPEDVAKDVAQFDRLLAGEIARYALDKRFLRKDGSVLWAQLSVNSVRRARGSLQYVVAILQDIGPRKAAEEALRESEARMARVLGGSSDGFGDFGAATGPRHHHAALLRDLRPAGRHEGGLRRGADGPGGARGSPAHPGRHGAHRRGREGLPRLGVPDPPRGRDPRAGSRAGARWWVATRAAGRSTSPAPSPTSPPGSSSRRSGNACSWNCRGPGGQAKTLSGFVPICAGCKKIRDDQGPGRRSRPSWSRHIGRAVLARHLSHLREATLPPGTECGIRPSPTPAGPGRSPRPTAVPDRPCP